ncbi:MAG: hypothetical protein EZS28_044747 [Streblomastix strix]|uniref:Uncharacterized protein n=1 Tax=Streblomastix strix TaxID=222440 RepID=A0A5J4TMI3_9EUKA|nr:MAG: hypothetical protein EZS28_044747 [Streblomastix strix]
MVRETVVRETVARETNADGRVVIYVRYITINGNDDDNEEEIDDEISVNEVDEFDGSDAFSEFDVDDVNYVEINEEDEIPIDEHGEWVYTNRDWFHDSEEDFDDYVRIFDRETYEESNKPNPNYVKEFVKTNE